MLRKLFRKNKLAEYESKQIFAVMLAFAIPAFLAAFVLSVEKLVITKDADAVLSCSINAVLNCASVMQTPQAALFGFPNSFLGIMGFAIVITVAMGGLLGVKYPRPYLLSAQFFYGLGLVFAYWLFFQSVYVIQILCPWCLVVTVATTVIFETLLRHNLRHNNFGLSKERNRTVQRWLDGSYDILITLSWIALLVVLIVVKFGNGLFA